jgi:dTDP-4-amino-4,6-dideoxygalactose transaminase
MTRSIRNKLFIELRKYGIYCQVHYIPVHLQPFYQEKYGFHFGDFPFAENYYKECISLPLFPEMSEADVKRVIEKVTKVLDKNTLR